MKERLVSNRSLCGYMAQWVVRQSPFISARGVDQVNQIIRKESEMWPHGRHWIVCQGPPACTLEGDAAVAAQQAGCPWCKRIIVHEDGTETVWEPGRG